MPIRFPAPLLRGDLIAVTSPSAGVPPSLARRLEFAVETLRRRGFRVEVGACMDGRGPVSAPAAERAAELGRYLTDPRVRAVIPPWGGDLAIDLLDLLDWEAIGDADPTWFIGSSDISTLLTPMTLMTGVATVHGINLLDTPYRPPEGLLGWLDVAELASGSRFTQASPGRYRAHGYDDFETTPDVTTMTLDTPGTWVRLGQGAAEIDVEGRLLGGCIDTLGNVVGTRYLDVGAFARAHAPEGLIVYLEAADEPATTVGARLHGMRLAGLFDHANAVLVGRTRAPEAEGWTQRQAVVDALGGLGIPIIGDVECGHVQPYLPLVNGALGHVVWSGFEATLTQTLA